MPLLVRGDDQDETKWDVATSKSGRELLLDVYEKYRVSSNQFRQTPIELIPAEHSLYVDQRECAVVPRAHAEDGIHIVGSDAATTCHILILFDEGSGTSAVCHFDDADIRQQLKTFLKTVLQVLEDIGARKSWDVSPISFIAYLIGGFDDARFTSERLSEELLWMMHTQPKDIMPSTDPMNFYLRVACISKLNTVAGPPGQIHKMDQVLPWPAICGAAIDMKTGRVFPCDFQYRGPEKWLRSARHYSDESDLLVIYDHKTKRVKFEPFAYYPIRHGEDILALPDDWILQNMSTSPMVEPPHFAELVRETIRFTLDNPDWRVVFSNGPIEYGMVDGKIAVDSMTQESCRSELCVRWAGDSPNANAIIKNSALRIGCRTKDTRDRLLSNGEDDKNSEATLSATPPCIRKRHKPTSSDDATSSDSSPNRKTGLFLSMPPKSPADGLLQKLKAFIAEKRNAASQQVGTAAALPVDTPNEDTCFDFRMDDIPETSTPITIPPMQNIRCEISPGRRIRMPIKRHRLLLPEDASNGAAIMEKEPFKATNQRDDDSLIASLDLDAFLLDARQKRPPTTANGTSFKRSKTAGDILDVFDLKISSKPVAPTVCPNMDDDDSFFADAHVLAEMDKLEQFCQTQRLKQ